MGERIAAAFVPLVDCAVLVAARELGFAAAEGIELELVKEPSWASLRDHLNLGYVDCAHALAPLPVASSLGVGHVEVEWIVPFVLGRGGNAITVSTGLFDEMRAAAGARGLEGPAAAGRALAAVVRRRSTPLTFGMVFPFSGHNFELRYWLAGAGVHPDRDVRLVAVPPPLMVESLRAGHIDGFCVGEPWNSLAVVEGLGRVVASKARLFPRGVEKVLALRAGFEARSKTLGALLRALAAAADWADRESNRAALAGLLARPAYLDVAPEVVEASLGGELPLGGDLSAADADFIYFHRHAANVPSTDDALWIYAQMARWGQLRPSAALQSRAARVFRRDLYERYVDSAPGTPDGLRAYDDVPFAPADLETYLRRFPLRTPFVDPASAR
jgi:NitT/TauT family transport system ATP-binding protein